MSEDTNSQHKNILLRGHGCLHPNIQRYLADDVKVKVWIDREKYKKRYNAPITHDLASFITHLKINRKTNALAIDYQYRSEFLSVYKELLRHTNTFLYMYSRKPILNGENNLMDMMDAFHIYIHFFIDLLKKNDIHCVFFPTAPHHSDYILYLVAKALNIKTVMFFQSEEPGKAFMSTSVEDMGSVSCDDKIPPILIKRNERKSYFYMDKRFFTHRPYIKVLSALLFRRDMDLFFHRLMNARKERKFKRNYKSTITDTLPSGKFVYFPLHLQPELSTQTFGGKFVDQMLAVECLRIFLPDDWNIVIKENPRQTAYARGSLFFARLKKIPNTFYMSKALDTFDLIDKAEFCATITGMVGLEALTFGKRVLVFGKPWYQNLPGIISYRDDLTFEEFMSEQFSHEELEKTYAKLVHNMADVVIDPNYLDLVDDFSAEQNTKELAKIINQAVRE